MISKVKKLKIISFSDVHLLHRLVPTVHIVQNLRRITPDDESMRDVDIIFIPGDVFDRSVPLHNPEIPLVIEWITYLFYICDKYGIALRVLEGTPGHDWKQSQLFVDIYTSINSTVDFRYVQVLEIEHMTKFDINVLYIPDEWRTRCCDTWNDVLACMQRHNLTQVDVVCMHGAFPHQLPQLWDGAIEMHNPDNFLNITKYIILIGHIHKYSRYKKIISHGSVDRLAQGEEGPKGWVVVTIYTDDTWDHRFIENTNAYFFRSLDLSGLNMDECDVKVTNLLIELGKRHGYICIQAELTDIATALFGKWKGQNPHVTWQFKPKALVKDSQIMDPLKDKLDFQNLPKLNRNNVRELVLARISLMLDPEDDHAATLALYAKELDEVINE